MDFSGTAGTGAKGDYGPVTGVGIFERGDTVNANGLIYTQIQGPGSGTVTTTYNGFIEANRWFTAKIFESNVAGHGRERDVSGISDTSGGGLRRQIARSGNAPTGGHVGQELMRGQVDGVVGGVNQHNFDVVR